MCVVQMLFGSADPTDVSMSPAARTKLLRNLMKPGTFRIAADTRFLLDCQVDDGVVDSSQEASGSVTAS